MTGIIAVNKTSCYLSIMEKGHKVVAVFWNPHLGTGVLLQYFSI